MAENAQFDSTVGGSENLPHSMSMAKYTAFRSQEISVMRSLLSAQSGTKLAFQTVPKHVRRRAMSHNAKRLPRRLRQIHLNQMKKSGLPAKTKRPSRKFRRRPKNLSQEYTRRATKKYRWLFTHIWHAKRFRMIEKWGYKIPLHPRDKSFRACYRAASQHCLLQDVSYMNCIEINGNKEHIIEGFKRMFDPSNGLSLAAKMFINGNREGELTLLNCENRIPIGNVNFHWQPLRSDSTTSRLWLWVHAAFYQETLNNIVTCFEMTLQSETAFYSNNSHEINLLELSNDLCRFRLTGPLANSILHDAFVLVDAEKLNSSWVKEYLDSSGDKDTINQNCVYWKNIKNMSPSEINPAVVLSLIVKDPRFNLPNKRSKSVPENFVQSFDAEILQNTAVGPLWEGSCRAQSNESRVSASKLAELRSLLAVPGASCEVEVYCPVIVVQKPGCRNGNIGFCSGWDVIVPSAWAKAFWLSFIMRGARVGGLRESNWVLFEMGKSQFLSPDTKAGEEDELQTSQESVDKFFRKPPAKRTNFNKFKIATPFKPNWHLLLQEWNEDLNPVETFSIVRDRSLLRTFESYVNSKSDSLPILPPNSLVPVRLICNTKGLIAANAIICLIQSPNDLKQATIEPICTDQNQIERKKNRKAHKILLKRFKKDKKKDEDVYQKVLTNYTKKMRSLWLPEARAIRNLCSREVIGYVTKGGFSYCEGKACGTGYVVGNSLAKLVKPSNTKRVLVRNTNSRQYVLADLSIIVE